MRTRALIAILILAILPLAAAAAPPSRGTSYFLAGDPHVPLAVVAKGKLRPAVSPAARGKSCGPRARWATVGSSWRALDAWGQVVASRKVVAAEAYDVTACAELAFERGDQVPDTAIYVSDDSSWQPSASPAFEPTAGERGHFEQLLASTVPDAGAQALPVPHHCTSIGERVRFFRTSGGERYAVGTSDTGYLVARLGADGWVAVGSAGGAKDPSLCYRPVAVFDMNGDGVPEIVLRASEGASWGDLVLGVDKKGGFRVVAESPGGATA